MLDPANTLPPKNVESSVSIIPSNAVHLDCAICDKGVLLFHPPEFVAIMRSKFRSPSKQENSGKVFPKKMHFLEIASLP